ncbi:MAG: NAD(P)H-hydrate epimerase, partial [Ignavibacteriales bacterium UTCHB3]
MIEVYSAKQAAEIDSIAIEERGFERTILMENAGRSVAEAIFNLDIERRSAAVICGKGHNGGDGIVAARHLRENGWEVLVVFIEDPEDFAPDTKYFFDLLVELDSGVSFFQYKDTDQLTELLEDCHLIIDAIFGTGFRGNLTMPYDEIILTLNDQYAMRVAIDIPSGINAGTGYGTIAFKAHWTVALGTHKLGYYYGEGINHCGTILNGFIGFNNSRMGVETNWSVYELPDTKSIIAPKKRTVNKYTAGGPVIVSGSNRYPGAATLTYQGAFFSGSGSPIIITSERAANVLLGHLPEAVVKDYPVAFNSEALKMMFEALEKKEVLLVGPGLDRSPETTLALEKIYNIEDRLVILDADGLFPLFNGNYKNYDLEGKIILPHTGEFANILGKNLDEIEENIFSEVTDFCEQTGAIVVLK